MNQHLYELLAAIAGFGVFLVAGCAIGWWIEMRTHRQRCRRCQQEDVKQ